MFTVIGRFAPQTFALMRIVSGLMFLMHGTQKLLDWPPRAGMPAPALTSQTGIGGLIELVCGALILLGLFTGIAAFIASGEMAVAFWQFHFPNGGIVPLVNKGELAALYCFVFLFIAAHGGGIWSLDNLFRKRPVVTS
jgi:putative oxidoreductase